MCIYFLAAHPDGLTASDLCKLCQEDKAGISRTLTDLEKNGYLNYIPSSETKKYRAKAILTDLGIQCAEKVNLLIAEAVDKASQNITPEDRAIFYRTLFTIYPNYFFHNFHHLLKSYHINPNISLVKNEIFS